ncbi:MAG: sugar transferase, partial [Phycisphaerae bacterium]
MRPLRILHVICSLQPGGAEHGLVKLICSLTPPQFRHAVLCIQTAGPLANHLPAHVPVSIAHTVNPLRAGLDVAELAQRFRPDVIHSLN